MVCLFKPHAAQHSVVQLTSKSSRKKGGEKKSSSSIISTVAYWHLPWRRLNGDAEASAVTHQHRKQASNRREAAAARPPPLQGARKISERRRWRSTNGMFILVHHFFCDQSGCKLKSVYSVSVVQQCKASLEWKTVHSSLFTPSLA